MKKYLTSIISRLSIKHLSLVLVLGMAIWIRLYNLGKPSFWYDEAMTYWITKLSWENLLLALRSDGGDLPLHFLILKFTTGFLGESEFELRILSTFVGILSIFLVMKIGMEVGGWPGMIVAGIFWAFHPMTVWYARDAKPYALTTAISACVLLVYLILQRRNSFIYWLIAFGALALGLLSHYYFFLISGAMIFFALVEFFHRPIFFRWWTLLAIVAFIPFSVWLFWYFQQTEPTLGIGWIQKPNIFDIFGTYWNMLSGYAGLMSFQSTIFGLLIALFVVVGILNKDRSGKYSRYAFVFGLTLPIIGVFILSQRRPIYIDRYFIVLLPFVALIASNGASRLWNDIKIRVSPSKLKYFSILCFVLILGIGLWNGWSIHKDQKYSREDWRGLAITLMNSTDNIPTIWFSDSLLIMPFRYYYSGEIIFLENEEPPVCDSICWWVLRQPYTATHAFAQGVTLPDRPWKPEVPPSCHIQDQWETTSGLAMWQIICN